MLRERLPLHQESHRGTSASFVAIGVRSSASSVGPEYAGSSVRKRMMKRGVKNILGEGVLDGKAAAVWA